MCLNVANLTVVYQLPTVTSFNRELKQPRRRPRRWLQKNNRFNDQNNSSACASRFLVHFFRPLHDYDMKPPNLTFYGGRGHTTTNFSSSFWAWIKSLRIQLQEKSPAFDILSRSKQTRLSLKENKFIFLPSFSLALLSSLLKVPINNWRCVRCGAEWLKQ